MADNKVIFQLIYGIALVVMGAALIFTIPLQMPKIEAIGFSPIIVWFCFIIMGIIMIGGGSKKIYDNYRKLKLS
ncbi:MAG: hypothetical protein GY749_01975 [Desulfobacteraceae bacterium]|nr:hypothetical protein [Desulfobacteraceae bacterium]MCP4345199.1 hypothetical protein [Desulfobacterales bacterium]